MELLKIEKYSGALKVFLRPTEDYPEGQNFFYCDPDFEDYIKNAKSFNFVSSKDGFRYPVVNSTSLHRTVMNTNNKQGAVVDHISGVIGMIADAICVKLLYEVMQLINEC